MRLKEILRLKISDVDLGSETITIRPENNKTGKLDAIPIRLKMRSIFERLKAENNGRSPFVFNYKDPGTGELRQIRTCQHAFEGARRRAKIKGLEFRDLQRTCATRLHEACVDPLIASRLIRHSSAKISAEVYIQSSMNQMKKAMEEADQEQGKTHPSQPIFGTFRTYLEHGPNKTKTKKEGICLFSMN
ncbi:MAG: tyrosine-type recombinase/integrase [Candidatus Aminicenantes bacterium]|nr:tyrosine-type recombinase/integrase [Candidatus Aminicenantes bacterium]